jgi:L-aminopeptidase/D-esterase-like protein
VAFDLGRGGDFRARPDAAMGAAAYDAAVGRAADNVAVAGSGGDAAAAGSGSGGVPQGVLGAGTGTVVGGLKGGIGSASAVLADGATVGAVVVLNAAGSAVDWHTGELYGARFGLPGEFGSLHPPEAGEVAAARTRLGHTGADGPPAGQLRATTLTVLGTDATLTPAQCTLLAQMGADGLARAVNPVHTMVDGDVTFSLATCSAPAPADLTALRELLAVAADTVTRALVHAALAAESVRTPAGDWPSYRELFPSAVS